MQLLTERYNKKIQGVIACYDRVVIHGTLPGFNYAQGMTSFLPACAWHADRKAKNIRIFDSMKKIWIYSEQSHEESLMLVLMEMGINGFQNKNLRKHLMQKTSSQVSRILKRLHLHGLIKKVRDTYKYYPTKLGRSVIATGLKLKELYIVPRLCSPFS